jgi:hypothetical protein
MKAVLTSAAEAKTGATFYNCQDELQSNGLQTIYAPHFIVTPSTIFLNTMLHQVTMAEISVASMASKSDKRLKSI